MNKNNNGSLMVLLSMVLIGNAKADITLELDRSLLAGGQPIIPILPLNGDAQYQLGAGQVNLQTKHAIICNRVDGYQPVSPLAVRVTDPNGDNKGDNPNDVSDISIMGAQTDISYNFSQRSINAETERRSKSLCLSSPEFDIIYEDGFGDAPIPTVGDLSYTFTNQPVGGYAPGDVVNYIVSYVNNTGVLQTVDFIEYYPYATSNAVYFNSGGNVLCEILDDDGISIGSCFAANGTVKDVELAAGHEIRMTLGRQLSPNSQVDSHAEMMLAVFAKVNTIDMAFGTSQSFSGFDFLGIRLPVVPAN